MVVWWYVCGGTDGAAGDPTRGARRCDRGGNLIPILPYNRATKGLGVFTDPIIILGYVTVGYG